MSIGPTLVSLSAITLLAVPVVANAKGECPAAVTNAAQRTYPDSKMTFCKEDGRTQYELKLETTDARSLELDVSADGSVLLTEEKVAISTLPKAVLDGFQAKYSGMKATQLEKMTEANGTVTWELGWKDGKKTHEATFSNDGAFLEAEK